MLFEILLSLAGYHGNVILSNEKGFFIDADIPFVQESEKVLINELCQLGFFYRRLDEFSKKHRTLAQPRLRSTTRQKKEDGDPKTTTIAKSTHGSASEDMDLDEGTNAKPLKATSPERCINSMYVRAMCGGIDEILESYLLTLSKAEQRFIKDPVMPLSYLNHLLREFSVLFPQLNSLVSTIEEENLRGGPLLDLLHQKSLSGMPIIQACMQRLLYHCNKVMLRHISDWMVYGILSDRYDEFFIAIENKHQDNAGGAEHEEEYEQHQNVNVSSRWKQFTIRSLMLPSYISLRVAKKILFIGKAIQVLQMQSRAQNSDRKENIPLQELQQFAEALRAHEDTPSLQLASFECTIDRIRSTVARYLWHLIVIDADLNGHLRAMKDYYLLSKGDFYQSFIDESHSLLLLPPSQNAEHDIRMMFVQAATKSSAEEDPFFSRLRIRIKSKTKLADPKKKAPSADQHIAAFESWKELYLEYENKWPLHLFFHEEVIDKYNKLFQLLFTIRRVQCELQRAYAPLVMQSKRFSRGEQARLMPLWQLRARMSFLIDNLLFYLQVDVLDVQYSLLQERIANCKDFESARKAHEEYLSVIANQCFLHAWVINQALQDIFELCMSLCYMVMRLSDNKANSDTVRMTTHDDDLDDDDDEPHFLWDKVDMAEVQRLSRAFQNQSNFLFTVLSGVKDNSSAPHLSQLLLRFDYNNWMSSNFRTTNNITAPSYQTLANYTSQSSTTAARPGQGGTG